MKNLKSGLAICLILVSYNVHAGELEPFTSDGCSAFPDGTLSESELWMACCTTHDLAYWKGGTRDQKREADEELKSCVAEVGRPGVASMMLAGVKVGGSPFWPTTFRWGYGWNYPKLYGPLTEAEIAEVKNLAPADFENTVAD
jgi:hypothetical protein